MVSCCKPFGNCVAVCVVFNFAWLICLSGLPVAEEAGSKFVALDMHSHGRRIKDRSACNCINSCSEGYLNMLKKTHYHSLALLSTLIHHILLVLINNPQAPPRIKQNAHKSRLLPSQQILRRASSSLRRIAAATSTRNTAVCVAVAILAT